MRQALKLHPDSRCTAVAMIDVDVARPRPGQLVLRYIVTGRIGDLRLAAATESVRADDLWRNTCFEAFVREAQVAAYYEFNFAPSTQWAAYRFDGTRSGRRVAHEISTPYIAMRSTDTSFDMQVSLDLPSNATWRLGLSAVIEETGGNISYWALAHPPGKPDFHHSDCFALELPAPSHP